MKKTEGEWNRVLVRPQLKRGKRCPICRLPYREKVELHRRSKRERLRHEYRHSWKQTLRLVVGVGAYWLIHDSKSCYDPLPKKKK